jgi:phosphoribosyl 1,2-cyclic phosphodiesterase
MELSRRIFGKSMAVAAGAGYLGKISGTGAFAESVQGAEAMKQKFSNAFKIVFLGTGAADWPFEKYPVDPDLLLSGSFRGSSSILLNGKILVDCGPTVPDAMEALGVDLSGLTDILITHSHADHFSLESLKKVIDLAEHKLNLWIEDGAAEKAVKLEIACNIQKLKTGKEYDLDGYRVQPLPANHRVSRSTETALHFLFSCESKYILYALDGAWLTTAAWKAVQNIQLDAVIWDGTIGDMPGDYRVFAHNSLPMIRLMNQSLKGNGVYSDSTRILLSHMARSLHPPHAELQAKLAEEGMEASHDGMVLELKR